MGKVYFIKGEGRFMKEMHQDYEPAMLHETIGLWVMIITGCIAWSVGIGYFIVFPIIGWL